MALKWEFVDRPSQRKVHAKPIPLLGGLAIYIGVLFSLWMMLGPTNETVALMVGGTLLVGIGLIDDRYKTRGKDFPVWPRLIVQAIAALVPFLLGIRIVGMMDYYHVEYISFPFGVSLLVTMLWMMALTNMINFIDGLDGLAAGIVTISSFTLFVISFWQGQGETAMMAVILIGAGLAFLRHNFHPAKIFMGDAGATFLGYCLALISIDGLVKGATVATVSITILALGVPIFDTIFVLLRRIWVRTGIFRGDRLHSHHSLMRWGLNQTQTVSFLYLIGMVFSLVSIILLLMT